MIRIIAVFFGVFIYLVGYSQANLDQIIISTLIKNEIKQLPNDTIFNRNGQIKRIQTYPRPEIVLLSETTTSFLRPKIDSFDYYKKRLTLLDRETYDDFCVKKVTSKEIDSIPDFEGTIEYISSAVHKEIFSQMKGWDSFRFLFDSKSLVKVSRPGLNIIKDKALIYLSISSSGKSGVGYYLILTKVKGDWITKESMMAWRS